MAEGREKVTGTVAYVAESTAGLKMEGDDKYWNAINKAKDYVKKDLIGKEVEIELKDKEKSLWITSCQN